MKKRKSLCGALKWSKVGTEKRSYFLRDYRKNNYTITTQIKKRRILQYTDYKHWKIFFIYDYLCSTK